MRPVVDRNRCEGKSDCARVCPYGVFVVRKLDGDERASLGLFVKLKTWANGGRQAFVVKGDDCHACGMCVDACPERAVQLVPVG